MASYSVAQAKNELPRLIDAALKGEEVVITRRGSPVVTMTATKTQRRQAGDEAFERLQQLRAAGPVLPMTSVELLNAMYEDDG